MKNKIILLLIFLINYAQAQNTNKPILHGKHWIAITGKPLGATAGAMIFNKGGNAVDAACAMVAATATMWDVLGWGGETQALIYHPKLSLVRKSFNEIVHNHKKLTTEDEIIFYGSSFIDHALCENHTPGHQAFI